MKAPARPTRDLTAIQIITATSKHLADAEALMFEYLAATQTESGRTVPATTDLAHHREPCCLRTSTTSRSAVSA